MAKKSAIDTAVSQPSRWREYVRVAGAQLRSALARLRQWSDAALHTWRRQRAVEAVGRLPSVRRVVFVCYGNVCRSPFAAAAYQRHLAAGATVTVLSAGFIGPGRQPPNQALNAASARGILLHDHRSCLVNHPLVRDADIIAVMSSDQSHTLREMYGRTRGVVVVLGDLDPARIRTRTIIDPWGADDAVFADSYDRILRCVGELARLTVRAVPRHETPRQAAS